MSDEQTKLDELAFALRGRSRGGFGLLVFETIAKQREIYQALEDMLPELHFHRLDLGSVKVGGLKQAITERVPQEALKAEPGTWVVNLFGLEHSISELKPDGSIGKTEVLEDMNFKRLQLFDFPFVVLVWTDLFFYRKFREQAPDLMDWVTIYFDFPGGDDPVLETPQSEKPLPKIAVTPERKRLIEHYLQRYEQLKSEPEQYERTVREKISLLTSLGREYLGYLDFNEAVRSLTTALQLAEQLDDHQLVATLHYELGGVYLEYRDFSKAELHIQQSFKLFNDLENEKVKGSIFHQLGLISEHQGHWQEAKNRYQEALNWYDKLGEKDNGGTHHHLGRVAYNQGKFTEAEAQLVKALALHKHAGREDLFGSTYHLLGLVAQDQERWSEAEARYQKALQWKRQTKKDNELGATYFNLGWIAQDRDNLSKAKSFLEEALKWFSETGQNHYLGITYRYLGNISFRQHEWSEAESFFLKSIEWNEKTSQLQENGLTYLNLGVLYAEQKRWLGAFEAWLTAFIYEMRDTDFPPTKDLIIKSLQQYSSKISHLKLQAITDKVLKDASDQERKEIQSCIDSL